MAKSVFPIDNSRQFWERPENPLVERALTLDLHVFSQPAERT